MKAYIAVGFGANTTNQSASPGVQQQLRRKSKALGGMPSATGRYAEPASGVQHSDPGPNSEKDLIYAVPSKFFLERHHRHGNEVDFALSDGIADHVGGEADGEIFEGYRIAVAIK